MKKQERTSQMTKQDFVWEALQGFLWFGRMAMDEQGAVCQQVASQLSSEQCMNRAMVMDTVKGV
jgi:hypothetical protein